MDATWYVEHRNVRCTRTACDDPRRFAERADRLERLGERGEVVLVEAGSRLVVARRVLPGAVLAAKCGAESPDRTPVP